MNQHDDGRGQDHGWVDPAEAGLLKQTFGAMAGGVDPASPTGPAATMSVMSKRVRRRRTVKLGGLGGGALALVGALVLGAGQLAPASPDRSELLPGSPSSSSTPTSSPVQADTPDFKVKDGYQPPWLEWSDLTCGMPVADLKSTASGWSVAPAGDIYARTTDLGDAPSTSWRMAAAIEEGPGVLDSSLALVWSQDGKVVDLGPDVFGAAGRPDPVPLISSDPAAYLEAHGAGASTCAPTGTGVDPVYEARLPEGDYDVRVVAFPHDGSGQDGSGTLGATVVSEPVAVHIDAVGAHSRTGTRGGESTIEPPEPVPGEISRFELDRSTDWVTASMTYRRHLPAPAVSVTARCESTNPADTVPFEVVLESTGQAYRSGEVVCDGTETVLPFGALGISGGAIDLRVPHGQTVPDGVARFSAVLAPSASADGTDPAGDCSASGLDVADDPLSSPSDAATDTADAILDAALACDSGELIELAAASGAELMVPREAPEDTFALPETAALPYRTLAALLGGTSGALRTGQRDDGEPEPVVWPRVAVEEFADSDEAWQEVVDAGLLTAEDAAAQRANTTHGYQGMVVSINEDGTWRSYYAVGAFPRQ
ncbi:hypothetical protein APR04_003962 [Promicromonospora umidemergens]|uniref:Uncharacterized protein n=1 Tax=Promicromonospora umidemergens TaxID=629679 RepID=A0ABP8X2B1_9MICO|nr:hypothetical protein [Promicromonospora umidemergens]MCP2285035.1 hypothetical protein [Promicromonospora umidemergens]